MQLKTGTIVPSAIYGDSAVKNLTVPALSIPPQHRAAMISVGRWSDDAFRQLVAALEAATPKLRTDSFAQLIAARTDDAEVAEGVVDALLEMALVRVTAGVATDVFVDDVTEAVNYEASDRLSDTETEVFRTRLTRLLGIPSIALPAKGRSLLIDHANYMCSARIFTDIRPVFSDDVHQSPATALVVHTLKMTYHQGEADTRNFFVVLDSADLDELSTLIERARSKEKSIQVLLASTGVVSLE